MAISSNDAPVSFSIFSYGFRPFFLAAGAYAILPIIPWLLYLMNLIEPSIPLQAWHAHEMIFGFVTAGIAGFLLSAIPNWTNTPPITGKNLKILFSLWFAGRFAFWLFLFFDHPFFSYLLFIDMLLPIAQFIHVSKVLISAKNNRNYIFIGILFSLALANFLAILDINDYSISRSSSGAIFATNILMITLSVIGGRVIPNFTRNYLKQKNNPYEIGKFSLVEKPALTLLILIAVLDLFSPHSIASYMIALLASIIHFIRFSRWGGGKTLENPIVWVLHLAYFLMIIALLLKGGQGVVNLPFNLYLHCFTVGSVGLFMIAIMSRASLGHTGRPLIVNSVISLAYLFVLFSALIRIVTPFFPSLLSIGMALSIGLWSVAYTLFLKIYIPILIAPRIDGKAG
ncbi:NnrS family protein [Hyphomicrobiales bacterium 4NK60-0047b]